MEQQKNFFTESKIAVEQYIRDRLLLIKLQMVEKISRLAAGMFTILFVAMLAFFILFFLSIMAGYYFAYLTDSLYIGFGIVALLYITILVIFLLTRKKILEKRIIDAVIDILVDKNNDDNENPAT